MFNQLYDGFRKVTESALHTQQEMFRQASQYWPSAQVPSASPAEAAADLLRKRWWLALTQTLEDSRDVLERAFRSSASMLALSSRFSDAKSPEEFGELLMNWWQSAHDTARSQLDLQQRFLQTVAGRWLEVAAKDGATAS